MTKADKATSKTYNQNRQQA